jgi:DNA-binding transcriptional regulator YdaS (Cro superfamily)
MSATLDCNMSGAYFTGVTNPIERAIKLVSPSTQEQLASELGVTQALVSQWLNGVTAVHTRHYEGIGRVTKEQVTALQLLEFERERLKGKPQKKAS